MSEPTALPVISSTPGGILVGTEPPRAANGQFTPSIPPVQQPATPPAPVYTAEDLASARQQEKNKLYGRIEEMSSTLTALQKEREERLAAEEALRKQTEAEAEDKRKAELTLKERVAQMESEMEAKFRTVQQERDAEKALYEKERELLALTQFRNNRVTEERDNILPELLDLVTGGTPEEIEQSIAGLRDRSDRILDGARQAFTGSAATPGARVTAPPAGPLDTNSEHRLPTPDEIRAMDINEYQKHRERLLGSSSQLRSRGLFG